MSKRNRIVILSSPIVIIGIVHFIARAAYEYTPEYCWLITAVSYWSLTGFAKVAFSPKHSFYQWFKKPTFSKKWLIISILIGIVPSLGILIPNFSLLTEYPHLTLFLIFFALINPWFEEGYWRGLLLDAGENLPRLVNILYSTSLFVLSHPLMWGVFSIANWSYQMFISLFVMGIVWSMIRYKTNSLRWSVYSHMLVDVGNLSVFVFLNLYIPAGM